MKKALEGWMILFACVQLTGLLCMWTWRYAPPFASSFVWGTAFIALFPGNVLSAILIERVFWSSGLSLTAMSVAEVPVMVVINAVLWWCVIGAIRRIRAQRSVENID